MSTSYAKIFRMMCRQFDKMSPDDVRDQIQRCLLKMLGIQDNPPPPGALKAYLIECVGNGLRDVLRHARHEVNPGNPIDESEDSAGHPMHAMASPDTPETLLANRALVECIKSHIRSFPTGDGSTRLALEMRVLDDASIDEIAAALGRSQQATRQLLSKQIRRLRLLTENCFSRHGSGQTPGLAGEEGGA